MHSTCVAAGVGEALAGSLAGDRLVLADVGDRADLLVDVGAGVDRDDRDAGVVGGCQRVLERVVVGHRDDEAVAGSSRRRRR